MASFNLNRPNPHNWFAPNNKIMRHYQPFSIGLSFVPRLI
jgi:hypothetical protein